MSIRNFPENPKIILRKSADQAKGAKNKNYEVAILICAGSLYFYVALPLKLHFLKYIKKTYDIVS